MLSHSVAASWFGRGGVNRSVQDRIAIGSTRGPTALEIRAAIFVTGSGGIHSMLGHIAAGGKSAKRSHGTDGNVRTSTIHDPTHFALRLVG
jgi:hypothetical protein